MRMIGVIGSSGSGKTTAIAAVLPLLRRAGLRVSTVKHAHHGFDMDRPGKDSFVHRESGAEEVMVVSDGRWALLRERRANEDASLDALIRHMTPVDLLIVEGFKQVRLPKIEVYRPSLNKPPFFPHDPDVAAVASDVPLATGLPVLPLAQPAAIAHFILEKAA